VNLSVVSNEGDRVELIRDQWSSTTCGSFSLLILAYAVGISSEARGTYLAIIVATCSVSRITKADSISSTVVAMSMAVTSVWFAFDV